MIAGDTDSDFLPTIDESNADQHSPIIDPRLPTTLRKYGCSRAICLSVSQYRSIIRGLLAKPASDRAHINGPHPSLSSCRGVAISRAQIVDCEIIAAIFTVRITSVVMSGCDDQAGFLTVTTVYR